ncbi:MAG: hypothetical protein QXP70_03580 [Methanomassiliicoccales archaeon]
MVRIILRTQKVEPNVERKALALLSGGIDSPVALWSAMRGGWHVDAIHFHSYPFSCSNAIQKAKELSGLLLPMQGGGTLYLAPFLDIQETMLKNTNPRLRVVLYRRMMARIAQFIALREGASLLITGDSLGQVSSQTLTNLANVDAAVEMPLIRPLIGLDKSEIVRIARSIGTYPISIRPHEDCCTLFTTGRPSTTPPLTWIESEESKLDVDQLVLNSVEHIEKFYFQDSLEGLTHNEKSTRLVSSSGI